MEATEEVVEETVEAEEAAEETVEAEETEETEETEEAGTLDGVWSAQKLVDEFGDEIKDSKPVVQTAFFGEFSNTATTGSELTGGVFMTMIGVALAMIHAFG